MRVKRFNRSTDKDLWNNFINQGKNSTFLFNRDFMDYHSDRFDDYSMVVLDDDGKAICVVPANITRLNQVVSHQGLTYGGFVFNSEVKLLVVLSVMYNVLKFLSGENIEAITLKQFPSFYNPFHTEELEYALFLLNAKLYRRDVAFVIDQTSRIPYSGNIRREGSKAEKQGAVVKEDNYMNDFWNELLIPGLLEKHAVRPVHSIEEISQLKASFPENIKQYNVYLDGQIVAGTTLFITSTVVHCQYISSNEIGRKSGALNHLFKQLVDVTYRSYRYFDFGIVNESEGKEINKGMLFWKESFGGRAQKHDFYEIATTSYSVLEKYIN
jgi:hypothetical protein